MKGELTISLSGELEEGMASIARRLRRKQSDVIRMALERFIRQETETSEHGPYDLVKELLGSVESGLPDLGTNHRAYLEGRIQRHA